MLNALLCNMISARTSKEQFKRSNRPGSHLPPPIQKYPPPRLIPNSVTVPSAPHGNSVLLPSSPPCPLAPALVCAHRFFRVLPRLSAGRIFSSPHPPPHILRFLPFPIPLTALLLCSVRPVGTAEVEKPMGNACGGNKAAKR